MTAPQPDIAALRAEVETLRARLDALERIIQIRDAMPGVPLLAGRPVAAPTASVAIVPSAPVAAAPAAPALPTDYDIAADQLLPAQDGFYKLEWGPEGAFRWTGPGGDVHFEAWIDRSAPLHAALTLFHLGTPANAKEMTLLVDGIAHPLQRDGTSKLLRGGPIAPRAGDGPTRFTLHVPHVHSPSSRGAPDKRMLGVAFQRLHIARG